MRRETVCGVVRNGDTLHYAILHNSRNGVQLDGHAEIFDADHVIRAAARASSFLVVLAEPRLLSMEAVLRLIVQQIDVSVIIPRESTYLNLGSPSHVARAAIKDDSRLRHVDAPLLERVMPLLALRDETDVRLKDLAQHLRENVESVSPHYAAVLAQAGFSHPQTLDLLTDHPTPQSLNGSNALRVRRVFADLNDSLQRGLLRDLSLLAGKTHDEDSSQLHDALRVSGRAREAALVASNLAEIDRAIVLLIDDVNTDPISPAVRRRLDDAEPAPSGGDHPPVDPPSDVERTLSPLRSTLKERLLPGFALLPPAWRAHSDWMRRPELVRVFVALREQADNPSGKGAERYRDAVRRIATSRSPLGIVDQIYVAISGQLIAILSQDRESALTYAEKVTALLDSESELSEPLRSQILADVDVTTGIGASVFGENIHTVHQLASALARMPDTRHELAFYGYTVLSYCLVMWGEHVLAQGHLKRAEALREELKLRSVPLYLEFTRLLLDLGSSPAESIVQRRENLESQTRGSPTRVYYLLTSMMSSLVLQDHAASDRSYAEFSTIKRRYPPQGLVHMSGETMHAMMLCSRGRFGEARRLVNSLNPSDALMRLLCKLIIARVDLAAGRHEHVFAATGPGGPLSPSNTIKVHERFVAASHVLRGTAHWQIGDRVSASVHFIEGVKAAAEREDIILLIAAGGPEMRQWLAQVPALDGVPDYMLRVLAEQSFIIDDEIPSLTPQQLRILRLLAAGRSVASIASELSVSPNTAKTHLRLLYRKLGVNSREQAVIKGETLGLL